MKIFLIYDALGRAHVTFLEGVEKLRATLAAESRELITLHSINSAQDRDQFIIGASSYDLVIIEPQAKNSSYSLIGYRYGELIVNKIIASQVPALFIFDDDTVCKIQGRLHGRTAYGYEINLFCNLNQLSSPITCDELLKQIDAHRENQFAASQTTDAPATAEVVKFPSFPQKPRLRIVGSEPPQ